ncbi:MAG: hypothetical protein IJJ82_01670 [Clostridia bacterium]|nr:hypothetical protein [Clostridia bacterium]
MYTINEVAKKLDCSVQNIYNQKNELIEKGYIVDGANGKEITQEGYNYLLQKRSKNSKVITPINTQEKSESEFEIENKYLKREIELLKAQLQVANEREKSYSSRELYYQEQLKTTMEDKNLFKAMYLQVDEANKMLLDTAENNKKKMLLDMAENNKKKRGLFKFFNSKNK